MKRKLRQYTVPVIHHCTFGVEVVVEADRHLPAALDPQNRPGRGAVDG